MVRLTAAFFVSQMIRRVNGSGGFAAVLKKGADEAGAVHIAIRGRSGALRFYRPALQMSYDRETTGGRLFQLDPSIADDMALGAFIEKEQRFDPDFWVVELETQSGSADLPFDIMTL
jgi:hypothetical protein